MRAVNNTLREIILRERPLTVTNNDSLVLSPPLLLPLFASLSIRPLRPPPSTCLSTLFLFTPRDLLHMPLYCTGASTNYRKLCRVSRVLFDPSSLLEPLRVVYIRIQSRVRIYTNPCPSSSPIRIFPESILDSKTFSSSAVPSRASKLIRSTSSVNAITTSACIQRGTDVTVVA